MNKGAEGDGHEDQSGSLLVSGPEWEVWLVFMFCHWAMLDETPLPEPTTSWNLPGAASGLWEEYVSWAEELHGGTRATAVGAATSWLSASHKCAAGSLCEPCLLPCR